MDAHQLPPEARRRLELARTNAALIAEIVGTGTAEDGKVMVTVGATGLLKDVVLDAKAMRLPSVDLAAAVLAAIGTAAADAARQTAALWADPADTGGVDIAALAQGQLDVAALARRLEQLKAAVG